MRRFWALVAAVAVVTVGLGVLAGCGEDEPAEPKPLSKQDGGKVNQQPAEGESSGDATPSSTASNSPDDESTEGGSGQEGQGSTSGEQKIEKGDRPEGPEVDQAKSIVREYYVELNKAFGNGDVSAISKLAASSCETCEYSKDYIVKTYSKGHKVTGNKVPNPDINASGLDEGGDSTVTIAVTAQIDAAKVLDSKGNEVDSSPPEQAVFIYAVDPSAGKIVKGRDQG